jgi:hypothetical protein
MPLSLSNPDPELTKAILDLAGFDPIRDEKRQPIHFKMLLRAADVGFEWFDREGKRCAPWPNLLSVEHCFAVYAPGLSPVAVFSFTFSACYADHGPVMMEIDHYQYKGGEHVATAAHEARRLELIAHAAKAYDAIQPKP